MPVGCIVSALVDGMGGEEVRVEEVRNNAINIVLEGLWLFPVAVVVVLANFFLRAHF